MLFFRTAIHCSVHFYDHSSPAQELSWYPRVLATAYSEFMLVEPKRLAKLL